MKLANPTSTAAMPTRLCKMATSSGISVICTRFAKTRPMVPPTTNPPMRMPTLAVTPAMVAKRARIIPMMP